MRAQRRKFEDSSGPQRDCLSGRMPRCLLRASSLIPKVEQGQNRLRTGGARPQPDSDRLQRSQTTEAHPRAATHDSGRRPRRWRRQPVGRVPAGVSRSSHPTSSSSSRQGPRPRLQRARFLSSAGRAARGASAEADRATPLPVTAAAAAAAAAASGCVSRAGLGSEPERRPQAHAARPPSPIPTRFPLTPPPP